VEHLAEEEAALAVAMDEDELLARSLVEHADGGAAGLGEGVDEGRVGVDASLRVGPEERRFAQRDGIEAVFRDAGRDLDRVLSRGLGVADLGLREERVGSVGEAVAARGVSSGND
jgi:hypothetical protein